MVGRHKCVARINKIGGGIKKTKIKQRNSERGKETELEW